MELGVHRRYTCAWSGKPTTLLKGGLTRRQGRSDHGCQPSTPGQNPGVAYLTHRATRTIDTNRLSCVDYLLTHRHACPITRDMNTATKLSDAHAALIAEGPCHFQLCPFGNATLYALIEAGLAVVGADLYVRAVVA